MYILVIDIHIKPELVDSFVATTLENVQRTMKEPGVARFDLIRRTDDPTRFVLFEVYRQAADHARHKETTHYKRWAQAAEPMLAEPRTRVLYESVYPEESGWE